MASLDDLISRAIDRFEQLFDAYDHVSVSFSGGKDSTCLLEVGTLAAARRGIKLTVSFFDEEVIFPETVDYCNRVRIRPELDFRWHCVPIKESNAWSQENPHWYPWAPEARSKWIRPIPPFAITKLKPPPKGRPSLEYLKHHMAVLDLPRTWVDVIGRRLAESPARRSMAQRLGWLQPPHDRRYCGIASTVRHNRARGSHGVEDMAHLITRLRAEGQGEAAIETMLGMSADERRRLEISEDAFLALMGGKDGSMGA